MECKGDSLDLTIHNADVLIETSWNVKESAFPAILDQTIVLIETSWNVKAGIYSQVRRIQKVLIETSWNVKMQNYQHRIKPTKY